MDIAAWLINGAYGEHRTDPFLNLKSPHGAAVGKIETAAKRIARNTLASSELTTDSLGSPVVETSGAMLGRFWSYQGGSKWVSIFCCNIHQPEEALRQWASWAHSGSPPYRLSLVDVGVPLIAPGWFAVASADAPRPGPFASLASATIHAAIVSLVETCRQQGHSPLGFITALLEEVSPEA